MVILVFLVFLVVGGGLGKQHADLEITQVGQAFAHRATDGHSATVLLCAWRDIESIEWFHRSTLQLRGRCCAFQGWV